MQRRVQLICALVVGAFLAQCAWFLQNNSQTSDEGAHLAAGYSYLETGDFRLNPEHPPLVKELAALAVRLWHPLPFRYTKEQWDGADEWALGRSFLYQQEVSADCILTVARLPTVLFAVLLLIVAGLWAAQLWGASAAPIAMALLAFDPNFVTHSCLVTTDLANALFTLLSLFALWHYRARPSLWRLFLTACAVAVGLASKFSMVFLLGVLPMVALADRVLTREPWRVLRRGRGLEDALAIAGVLLAAALIVPAAYGTEGVGRWLWGLQLIFDHQKYGHPAFLMGQYAPLGWWYYFPLVFLVKMPAGTLLLLPAALIFAGLRGRARALRAELYLWLPVAAMGISALGSHIDIGFRHVLGVLPLMAVALSGTILRFRSSRVFIVVGALLLTWNLAAAVRIGPHHLAFVNELFGGPARAIDEVSDANLDWGQDLANLGRFAAANKGAALYVSYFGGAPPSYYLGTQYEAVLPNCETTEHRNSIDADRIFYAVSVFNLQGVRADESRRHVYDWLKRRRPIAKLGWSIYVYDVSDFVGRLRLQETIAICDQGGCGIPPYLGSAR